MKDLMCLQNLSDKSITVEAISLQKQTEKYGKAVEQAIKTLRKTTAYGYATQPNFEWPTANDLLQMPKNMQIKFKELQYKKCSNDCSYFGGFTFTLSNGLSKNFTGSTTDTLGMTSFAIPDY